MNQLVNFYIQHHPERAAAVLEGCTLKEFRQFFESHFHEVASLLPYMSPTFLNQILSNFPIENVMQLFAAFSDTQIGVMLKLLKKHRAQEIVKNFKKDRQNYFNQFLQFHSWQVGFYATIPALVLSENETISKCLKKINTIDQDSLPVWVVNSKYEYVGALSLLKVLHCKNDKEAKIKAALDSSVHPIKASVTIEKLKEMKSLREHAFFPVVGNCKAFLGVLKTEDVIVKEHLPSHQEQTAFEEYVQFSEIIWDGLNRFWSALR